MHLPTNFITIALIFLLCAGHGAQAAEYNFLFYHACVNNYENSELHLVRNDGILSPTQNGGSSSTSLVKARRTSILSAPTIPIGIGDKFVFTLMNAQFPVVENFSCIMEFKLDNSTVQINPDHEKAILRYAISPWDFSSCAVEIGIYSNSNLTGYFSCLSYMYEKGFGRTENARTKYPDETFSIQYNVTVGSRPVTTESHSAQIIVEAFIEEIAEAIVTTYSPPKKSPLWIVGVVVAGLAILVITGCIIQATTTPAVTVETDENNATNNREPQVKGLAALINEGHTRGKASSKPPNRNKPPGSGYQYVPFSKAPLYSYSAPLPRSFRALIHRPTNKQSVKHYNSPAVTAPEVSHIEQELSTGYMAPPPSQAITPVTNKDSSIPTSAVPTGNTLFAPGTRAQPPPPFKGSISNHPTEVPIRNSPEELSNKMITTDTVNADTIGMIDVPSTNPGTAGLQTNPSSKDTDTPSILQSLSKDTDGACSKSRYLES